jgi:hypothetical protein
VLEINIKKEKNINCVVLIGFCPKRNRHCTCLRLRLFNKKKDAMNYQILIVVYLQCVFDAAILPVSNKLNAIRAMNNFNIKHCC